MTAMPRDFATVAATGSRAETGMAFERGAEAHAADWQLAEEVPVAILYNSQPHVVMMATPADLVDFGRGFTLAEGIAPGVDGIGAILALPVEQGLALDIALRDIHGHEALPRRAMEGRAGCGVCGIEDISDAVRKVKPVERRFSLSAEAAARAMAQLPAHQLMNQVNHSVHAAGWASPEGEVTLVREDVGRHCALDKLIGALAARGEDFSQGFAVMTSRCSFELVQKAATVGIGHLATMSAPTAFAVDLAKRLNVTLATRSRGGTMLFGA